jgi:oxygen-independent coproporphyrinogen III oxidase
MNFASANLVFDTDIIRRFDVNGPRYTSYPTADRFTNAFGAEDYRRWLQVRGNGVGEEAARPLSLYFHIPFCNTICYYCGCNKIITKDHGRSAKYIRYLAKELALQSAALTGPHDVIQLHFGGGTPTFLADDEMRTLMGHIKEHFNLLPGGEYSIEVDPRKVDAQTVALLGEVGFNRMSIGVQDFDENVQKAVNRIQSEAETLDVIRNARANGFNSISVDLIYGLPLQTVDGFERTLDRVLATDPDRLSIYNYAHLPKLFMPQRRISEADLPSADAKLQILSRIIRKLTDAGYVFIGMDHFAKPTDELAIAQQKGELQRNFQGYSTHADCDLLAFGISAISKVGRSYGQSVKTLDEYYGCLDEGVLPVYRGIELDDDDVLRRDLITQLMCHFRLSMPAVNQKWGIDFKDYFATELADLQTMVDGGLVQLEEDAIVVLPKGRMLVRVIAMAFDKYLRQGRQEARYSKVI